MSLFHIPLLLIATKAEYSEWNRGYPDIPDVSSNNMISGHYNQSIWLFNGYDLLEYETVDQTFTDQSDIIPNDTKRWKAWGYGQYWTQIHNIIYYISDYILSYDLQHKQFAELDRIDPAVGLYSCLASLDPYLFVIGGTGPSDSFFVFDISVSDWKVGSSMNERRSYHSCIVSSNNYLYAICGDSGKGTIEKVNVNADVKSIVSANNKWKYAGNLTIGYRSTRAVVHCNNILIIGGLKSELNATDLYNGEIFIINITTDKVSVGGNLNYAVWGTAVVISNNILYAFGGKTDGLTARRWQYTELPQLCETKIETNEPTKYPTENPIMITEIVSTQDSQLQDHQHVLVGLYNYILLCIIGIFISLILFGLIDSVIHRNDVFRLAFIISFGVYSIDFISDIFFALNIFIKGSTIIFIISLLFILIPVTLSLYQLYKGIKLWMNDTETGSFVSVYMDNHTKFIYIISLICGSGFASISLLNSGLFRMTLFDMALKKQQITAFQNQRLYTVVLIENIPQMVLQIVSIIMSGGIFETITLMALLFSLFSIILSIFEYLTKKSVIQTQIGLCNVWLIGFDIISESILRKRSSFRYQRKKINGGIAEILKVDLIFIEQLRSLNVRGGLTLNFRVRCDKKIEIETIMHDAIGNGTIAELIRNSWKLQNVPIIKDLSVNQIESAIIRQNNGEINTHSNIPLVPIDSETVDTHQ